LVEGLLPLVVTPTRPAAALAAEHDFVDEDDAGRIFLGLLEEIRTRFGATRNEI